MKKIAVITIHGMGETELGYATQFGQELASRVGQPLWDENVHFSQIYFQNTLQENQHEVWQRSKGEVNWKKIRRFFLYSFSDATSLETNKDGVGSKYTQVQKIVLDSFVGAFGALGSQGGPVIVVGYSLGGQVISNYLWDASRPNGASVGIWQTQPAAIPAGSTFDGFARGRTIKRFFTCGCNIPIFVSGHDVIEPIPKPNREFEWHNYFDEDDVLGWPLQPLSDGYNNLVKDHEINAGGSWIESPVVSWNPLSHTAYLKDGDFIEPISNYISSVL